MTSRARTTRSSPPHRELAEEVGKRAGPLDLLAKVHQTPGLSDEFALDLPRHRTCTDVAHDRQGVEEEHMTIEDGRARPTSRR